MPLPPTPPPQPPLPPSPPRATDVVSCVYRDDTYANVPTGPFQGGINSCYEQANCIDVYMDSSGCSNSGDWLYCEVCLLWGQRSGCPKSTSDTISHICLADEITPFIRGASGAPAVQSTAKVDGWRPFAANRVCQFARWGVDDTSRYRLYFTVKDASGYCLDGTWRVE